MLGNEGGECFIPRVACAQAITRGAKKSADAHFQFCIVVTCAHTEMLRRT